MTPQKRTSPQVIPKRLDAALGDDSDALAYTIRGLTAFELGVVMRTADEFNARGVQVRARRYSARRSSNNVFRVAPLWFARLISSYWETGANESDLSLEQFLQLALEGTVPLPRDDQPLLDKDQQILSVIKPLPDR